MPDVGLAVIAKALYIPGQGVYIAVCALDALVPNI